MPEENLQNNQPIPFSEPNLDPYQDLLIRRKIGIPYTTTLPSDTPLDGERRIYDDGTNYWLYIYSNGAWRSHRLGVDIYITNQAQGDIIYFNGSIWTRLPAGTSGGLLQTQGTGANPQWVSFAKFGGTGADGALTLTSGTTTIDLGGAQLVVKNYTSISITGTGKLAFSNPHANGTNIILRSQGNVTITSSATCIDCSGLGANGGAGGASAGAGAGTGGTGGSSQGANSNSVAQQIGTGGVGSDGTPAYGFSTNNGGSGGEPGTGTNPGATGAAIPSSFSQNFRVAMITPGSGGGGGGGGANSAGGAGGKGGGALFIECAGAWNFTTSSGISVAGLNGSNGGGGGISGGNGGGGGAGTILVLYNTLTANSGTCVVSGGAAGTEPAGGAGSAGANGYAVIEQNTVFL